MNKQLQPPVLGFQLFVLLGAYVFVNPWKSILSQPFFSKPVGKPPSFTI